MVDLGWKDWETIKEDDVETTIVAMPMISTTRDNDAPVMVKRNEGTIMINRRRIKSTIMATVMPVIKGRRMNTIRRVVAENMGEEEVCLRCGLHSICRTCLTEVFVV